MTTNPTIFAKAISDADAYAEQVSRLGRARASPSTRRSGSSRPTTSATPPTCSSRRTTTPRVRTAGCRSRSSRPWRTTPRRRSTRPSSCGTSSAGRTSSSRSRPPRRACRRSPRRWPPGISVNVTLIFSLERYKAVTDAFLTGLEQAVDNGHDVTKLASVASFFVSRVDTRDRQATGRHRHRRGEGPEGQGRDRQRPARLRGVRGDLRLRPLARDRDRRRQAAAPAVGVHRRQGPGVQAHPVRRRAGHPRRREHDAARQRSTRSPSTARSRGDTVRGDYDGGPQGDRRPGEAGHLVRRGRAAARGRGRQQVRRLLVASCRTPSRRPSRRPPSEHSDGHARRTATGPSDDRPAGRGEDRVPDRRARTPRSGARRPSPSRRSGSTGSTCTTPRGRCWPRSRRCRPTCGPRAWTGSCSSGMGGSSLAPEVITRTAGVELVVLDSTNPSVVARALAGDLQRTVIVVSSKSGGTVETDSQRRVFVEGVHRRRDRRVVAGRRRDGPGFAVREAVGGRGLPQDVPRRPERRWALQRADRVRPGPVRSGRCRHRRAARPGGRGGAGSCRPTPRTTRRSCWAQYWLPARAGTRRSSRPRAPTSSGSRTGPSS